MSAERKKMSQEAINTNKPYNSFINYIEELPHGADTHQESEVHFKAVNSLPQGANSTDDIPNFLDFAKHDPSLKPNISNKASELLFQEGVITGEDFEQELTEGKYIYLDLNPEDLRDI